MVLSKEVKKLMVGLHAISRPDVPAISDPNWVSQVLGSSQVHISLAFPSNVY